MVQSVLTLPSLDAKNTADGMLECGAEAVGGGAGVDVAVRAQYSTSRIHLVISTMKSREHLHVRTYSCNQCASGLFHRRRHRRHHQPMTGLSSPHALWLSLVPSYFGSAQPCTATDAKSFQTEKAQPHLHLRQR